MKCPKCKADNPDDSRFCNKCGNSLIDIPTTPTEMPTETGISSEKSALGFSPGQHFGKRYQIIEEISRGGMGRVYKAVDNELDRIVALKMIKPEISSQPGIVERFKKEIKLASQITHKNVCRIHDLGEEKEIKFISMQYIEGQDLKKLIQQTGKLIVEKAIAISKRICAALQAAHDEGVIHRDLKSQNIMIDSKGNAYVMDFGIARSLESEEVTKPGVVIGTPHYMSPEQAEGKEADARSDIYALGCIMYEMLTGKQPFEAETSAALLHKHIKETPKLPSQFNPQIPKALEEIILKCLEKKPEKRYQIATAIIKAIDAANLHFISTAKPAKILKKSIAVLPFVDMSPREDQEYFCEGISEELINTLTKVEGLQVASRTSAFQFKRKGYNIHKIADELKVQTVLEGSVRKAGNRLRIAAQLINAEDGYHLWSEKYDRDLDDVLVIQDEISLAIVDKLKVKLLGEEKAALIKHYTDNLDAYNLYLKGRYYWNKKTEKGFQRAIEHFQLAVEKEPTYALAYAGLADCYILLSFYGMLHPKEALPKAKTAAEKALQIDDFLAEAHTSLAWLQLCDWNWSGAEREFKRAIELNPSYAQAHQWYAAYLSAMSRHDEAISEAKRGQELDPLTLQLGTHLGITFYLARQYDRAIEQFQKMLEMDANYILTHFYLGFVFVQKAMYKEAITEFQKTIELSGERDSMFISWLGITYSMWGKRDEAKNVLNKLDEISKQRYVSPLLMAAIYMGLNKKKQVLECLEKAYEERDHWLIWLKLWPFLESLRSDPRFKALLKKMNLE